MEGEESVHIELSETDTESFEDLGPKVALANGGVFQPQVTSIEPPTPTVAPAHAPAPTTDGTVLLRRATSTEANER